MIEWVFAWLNGLSKAKNIHEYKRNKWTFPIISLTQSWEVSPGQGESECYTRKKAWLAWNTAVLSHMCLRKISTIWNTVMVIRWEDDQLQENLNRLFGKGHNFYL